MTILNEQQIAFQKSRLQDAKIFGNPGVGKTTGIIHKICHHYDQGDLTDKKNFIIVMFTNNAQREFIERGRREEINRHNLFSNRNVMTIHKLAGRVFQHFGIAKKCDVSTVVAAARMVLSEKTIQEIRQIPLFHDLRLMIVDEAQDISETQYNFLMEIKKKLGNVCILIGDPNQNIFQFQGGSDRFLLEYNGHPFHWTINNRSTQAIVRFANYFRPNDFLPAMVASRKDRSTPIKIYRLSVDRVLDKMCDILQKSGIERSDIAIISPVKRSHRQYNSYRNIGLSLVENRLSSCSIPFVIHYPAADRPREKPKRQTGKVNLHTIHSSKGDEFHTVLLLNFHFFTQGTRPTYEEYNRFTYLWWVAVTRARNRLVIFMDEDKDHWPLLQTVPTHAYRFYGKPIVHKTFEVDMPLFSKKVTIPQLLHHIRDDHLHAMERVISYGSQERTLYTPNHTFFSPLLEHLVRLWFFFLASQQMGAEKVFVQQLVQTLENKLSIPLPFRRALSQLVSIIGSRDVTLEDVHTCKDQWADEKGMELYLFLTSHMKPGLSYSLLLEDGLIHRDDYRIRDHCYSLERPGANVFQAIFEICLYQYQTVHEKKHMWDKRRQLWEQHLPFSHTIAQHLAIILEQSEITPECLLHHRTDALFLQLKGTIDVYDPIRRRMMYFVFQESLTQRTIYGSLLNYNHLYPKWDTDVQIDIYNMLTGIRHRLDFQHTQRFPLLQLITLHAGQKFKKLRVLYSTVAADPSEDSPIVDYAMYLPDFHLWIEGNLRERISELFQMCDYVVFIAFHDHSHLRFHCLDDSKDTLMYECKSLRKILLSIDPTLLKFSVGKCYRKVFSRVPKGGDAKSQVRMMQELITHYGVLTHLLI